jgi:hypothetical protein
MSLLLRPRQHWPVRRLVLAAAALHGSPPTWVGGRSCLAPAVSSLQAPCPTKRRRRREASDRPVLDGSWPGGQQRDGSRVPVVFDPNVTTTQGDNGGGAGAGAASAAAAASAIAGGAKQHEEQEEEEEEQHQQQEEEEGEGSTAGPNAAGGAKPPVPLLVLSHPACLLHNIPGRQEWVSLIIATRTRCTHSHTCVFVCLQAQQRPDLTPPPPPPKKNNTTHTGHFERPQRVTAILEALKASRLLPPHAFCLDGEEAAPRATRLALERFHTKRHVEKVNFCFWACFLGGGRGGEKSGGLGRVACICVCV